MDISSSSLLLQDGSALLFDCESLLDQSHLMSDAGYYSASLSPTSSIDSCGFSPPAQKITKKPKKTGRPSSKFPGVKRENASEREKLRMRDLTKALHHLRNYLPPSVAPAGKTLTKIETLRLTIQYISSLSEQLGSGEEEAGRGVSSEETQNEVPSMFVNFSEASSVAQHFQSCCLNTNEDPFQTFQTQNFWIHQQASFFPGQC